MTTEYHVTLSFKKPTSQGNCGKGTPRNPQANAIVKRVH